MEKNSKDPKLVKWYYIVGIIAAIIASVYYSREIIIDIQAKQSQTGTEIEPPTVYLTEPPSEFKNKTKLENIEKGTLSKEKLHDYFNPNEVCELVFVNTLNSIPENASDLSSANNNSVMAWMDSGTLYIAGNGGLYAPADCSYLFSIVEASLEQSAHGRWDKMTSIQNGYLFDTSNVTDMRYMFCYCTSLETPDISNWNTSNVQSMECMFESCSNLKELDLDFWDTSNVQDMYRMFYACSNLTSLNISRWNTSNVRNTKYMFVDCGSLESLDVSQWNISKITTFSYMFSGTKWERDPPYPFSFLK